MDYPETTKLYKYRGYSSRTLTALSNNELYFASSNLFNDPFDCRARKEFEFKNNDDFVDKWTVFEQRSKGFSSDEAKTYLTSIVSDPVKREKYIKWQSEHFQKVVLQPLGICSFSEINNDILMWSHYADSHYGLCLEFNRTHSNMLKNAQPTIYPKDDNFPFIDYWIDSPDELLAEVEKIVLTKSKHWSYEKEWRIIQRKPDNSNNYKGHAAPYPKELLAGVIFGYRMRKKERKTIEGILSDHSVQYYEAKPIKNKFLIEILML